MPLLICTVGLPRSGKSTWSLKQGFPIVNPDSIRLSIHGHPFIKEAEPLVWAVTELMVKSLFKAGHTRVILDACNSTRARRDEWVRPDEWTTAFIQFSTPVEVCEKRALDGNRPDLVKVINDMFFRWETVQCDERLYTPGRYI